MPVSKKLVSSSARLLVPAAGRAAGRCCRCCGVRVLLLVVRGLLGVLVVALLRRSVVRVLSLLGVAVRVLLPAGVPCCW